MKILNKNTYAVVKDIFDRPWCNYYNLIFEIVVIVVSNNDKF